MSLPTSEEEANVSESSEEDSSSASGRDEGAGDAQHHDTQGDGVEKEDKPRGERKKRGRAMPVQGRQHGKSSNSKNDERKRSRTKEKTGANTSKSDENKSKLRFPEYIDVSYEWPDDDHMPCSVCCEESGTDDNEILFCEGKGCRTAVHQYCYGIKKIPKGKWLCDACKKKLDPKKAHCILCPVVGGAVRILEENDTVSSSSVPPPRYAHIACAIWTPGVVIHDPENMKKICIESVETACGDALCQICRQRGGSAM